MCNASQAACNSLAGRCQGRAYRCRLGDLEPEAGRYMGHIIGKSLLEILLAADGAHGLQGACEDARDGAVRAQGSHHIPSRLDPRPGMQVQALRIEELGRAPKVLCTPTS